MTSERDRNFDNIAGQKEIIAGLTDSIKNNRIGHAYIFNGPRGIGKKTIAGIFAGLLLCEKHNPYARCGECLSCRMFECSTNPDFNVVGPGCVSIGVDEIREIQSDIIIRPLYSTRKIYLIIDADKMTVQAQNCLLKTLEEPPEYVIVILTTSNCDALLETIRSRAVKLNFIKNTKEEVRILLEKNSGKTIKGFDFIISYANGIIGTALELASSGEFALLREKTIQIILQLSDAKLIDVFEIYDFFETNKDEIDSILDMMLLFYRDVLLFKKTGDEKMLINSDKKDIILNNVSGFSAQKLIKNMDIIDSMRRNIKQNANYQLCIEVMLMGLQEDGV